MLFISFVLVVAACVLSFASLSHGLLKSGAHIVKHGMFPARVGKHGLGHEQRVPLARRQLSASNGCGSTTQLTTKAPKSNIFLGLTDDEAAAVTAFLHDQKELNLTAAASATR